VNKPLQKYLLRQHISVPLGKANSFTSALFIKIGLKDALNAPDLCLGLNYVMSVLNNCTSQALVRVEELLNCGTKNERKKQETLGKVTNELY
jgi:hypothetical protein